MSIYFTLLHFDLEFQVLLKLKILTIKVHRLYVSVIEIILFCKYVLSQYTNFGYNFESPHSCFTGAIYKHKKTTFPC